MNTNVIVCLKIISMLDTRDKKSLRFVGHLETTDLYSAHLMSHSELQRAAPLIFHCTASWVIVSTEFRIIMRNAWRRFFSQLMFSSNSSTTLLLT